MGGTLRARKTQVCVGRCCFRETSGRGTGRCNVKGLCGMGDFPTNPRCREGTRRACVRNGWPHALLRRPVSSRLGGGARTNFEFHPSDNVQTRIVKHATNAASSRRYQIADGPDFWQSQGASAPFLPPPSKTAPGTSPNPDSLLPSGGGLLQFGRRVFGGPDK
jgi:hypothetical protein